MLSARNLFLWCVCCLTAACDMSKEPLVVTMNAPMPEFATRQGDLFYITHGDIKLTLKPMIGGRISSLTYQSQEILLTQEHSNNTLWGSVLWSSPQKDWNWPPVEVLDSKPYSVRVEQNELVFTSDVDKKTGYQFVKSYGVVPDIEALRIVYRIINRSDEVKEVAPWEVTRVPPSGITFFPKGEGGFDSGIFYPLAVETIDDIVWFKYDAKKMQEDHHKLLCDGREGWLAYTNRGYLFVKQFEDVPRELIAPTEGEIELFANAEKTYMELEQQGKISRLQPDEYLDWEVIWHVKKLPEEISAEVGSTALVQMVRNLVSQPLGGSLPNL